MTSTQIEEGATPMMPAADAPASAGVAGRLAVVERCLDGALLTEPLDAAAALSQVIRWNRGSTPFSRTLTRRPIQAMRSVHVKA